MPRTKQALFSYFIAASILANLLLTLWVWFTGPESTGITVAWFARPVVVQRVAIDSPAARAGIRPGDRLLTADGHPVPTLEDWRRATTNVEVGSPFHLKVKRASTVIERDLTFHRREPGFWISAVYGGSNLPAEQGIVQLTFIVAMVVYVALAVLILLARPGEPGALFGALFLNACNSLTAWPEGFASAWRHSPMLMHPLLWVNEINLCLGFGVTLTFMVLFPKPMPRSRLLLLIAWTPDLIIQPWLLRAAFDFVYRPDLSINLPDWLTSAVPVYWVVYLIGAVGLAIVNYRRLNDPNDRRRVRLIFVGLCIAVIANLPRIVFARGPLSSAALASTVVSPAASIVASLASLSIPISFAIAITRDRLFDIQILIRQGVRYAIARGTLLSVAPALALVLGADLAFHADQPLSGVLEERGWIYASVGAIAIAAHVTRKRWLNAVDRHFFREKYNAERLLRDSVEIVRNTGSFVEACAVVMAGIEATLHPEFVGVFIREPSEPHFHRATGVGRSAPQVFDSTLKIVSLLRILKKPLDASQGRTAWMDQLPQDEVHWLEQERVELFVPIATSEQTREALLLLGPKRSEEPYSKDDREILQGIAAGLALSFTRVPYLNPEVHSFRECPACGACEASDRSLCPQDGSPLVTRNFARVLRGRYRIEQRLGGGGMGSVYQATDLLLQRRVAVKLIREDVVSPPAIARFEQEARIAAGFSHPSVVTVFDFGVSDNTRPFLVMELLAGETLRASLRKQGRTDPARTQSIFRSLCAGVHAAHERGFIHRDLKPENIFLTQEGVKILDFGLSKLLAAAFDDSDAPTMTQLTAAGTVVGTLDYMAPEQLGGAIPSTSWDIWALGVISYEMLTGTRPFTGSNPAARRNAIRHGKFAPFPVSLPGASALSGFYERVFSLDPENRPATTMTLLEELTSALSNGLAPHQVTAAEISTSTNASS